jgi:hypothetical protein
MTTEHAPTVSGTPDLATDQAIALAPPQPRPQPRPPVAFGIVPQTLDDAWRYAQMLAASDLVPKDYRGKPENCMVAMQYGAEVGLKPMNALQSIAVINGKPGLYGDGFLAVIMDTPAYAGHEEFFVVSGEVRDSITLDDLKHDDTAAITRFYRVGRAAPFVGTFSVADARKANLLGKDGPWTQYPTRMLRWRARGFAGRDAFARELRGMGSAEELRDHASELHTSIQQHAAITAPIRRSALPAATVEPATEQEPTTREATATAEPRGNYSESITTGGSTPAAGSAAVASRPRPVGGEKAGAPTTLHNVVVEETLVVQGDPFEYEIHILTHDPKRTIPMGYTFFTTDKALYDQAVSCEGTGVVLHATYATGPRSTTGQPAKILQALVAAD